MEANELQPSLEFFEAERPNVMCSFVLTVFNFVHLRGEVVHGKKGPFVALPSKLKKTESGWERLYSHWDFVNSKDKSVWDLKDWIVGEAIKYSSISGGNENANNGIPF